MPNEAVLYQPHHPALNQLQPSYRPQLLYPSPLKPYRTLSPRPKTTHSIKMQATTTTLVNFAHNDCPKCGAGISDGSKSCGSCGSVGADLHVPDRLRANVTV